MKLVDMSDAQFTATYKRTNVETLANVLKDSDSSAKNCRQVIEKAKALKLGRCKRLTKKDTEAMIAKYKDDDKGFAKWVKEIENEPLPEPVKKVKKEKAVKEVKKETAEPKKKISRKKAKAEAAEQPVAK